LLKEAGMSVTKTNSATESTHPVRYGTRVATLYEAEWMHILAVLAACDGNVSRAARALGLARQSLQRKLRRLPPLSMLPAEQLQQAA
jgi:ActR/RegA family two-component response regulator